MLIVRGPSQGPFINTFLQYLGIFTSIISVTIGTARWHIYNNRTEEEKARVVGKYPLIKSLMFFLPHTLFRLSSLAFIYSFLKYYSLIPFATFSVLNLLLFVWITRDMNEGRYQLWSSLPFTTLATTVALPRRKEHRVWMKRSLLLAISHSLLCLIVVRLLSIFASPISISATTGLSHVHRQQSNNSTGKNFLSHEQFSSNWFQALIVLGTLCLVGCKGKSPR